MNGVFWHDDVGFVPDRRWAESHFPDGKKIEKSDIDSFLAASNRLPNLGSAPVSSWVVARLFFLTRQQLGIEPIARLRNDGGGVPLHFIAFTRDLKPLAFLYLRCESSGIELWGECTADASVNQIISAFTGALLQDPGALTMCRLTTVDTDPVDLAVRRFGKPELFGWNGKAFLGRLIDQQAILAEAPSCVAAQEMDNSDEDTPARQPVIEIAKTLVPSINGVAVETALSVKALYALLGTPQRVVEPKTRAPVGHRNNRLHVYDTMGLIFWEHHYTRRITHFKIVFRPDEMRLMGTESPPPPFHGLLRVAGFTFPNTECAPELVVKDCPIFHGLHPGAMHVTCDGFSFHLHAEGTALPNGRRSKSLRLMHVELSWPHDDWGTPVADV